MPFLPTVSAREFREHYPEIGFAFGDNACAPECFVSTDRGHEPSTVDELVRAAVGYRQLNPNTPLADDILEAPDSPVSSSYAANLLISICNQSQEQPTTADSFGWDADCDFGTCGLAEPRFAALLHDMEKRTYGVGARLYIDSGSGEPLLLQKHPGSKTALTLKPLQLNGITFEPGWITGITDGDGNSIRPDEYSLQTSNMACVGALSPQRPSAFAYPQNQREIFASNCWKASPDVREIITEWSMQDVILAVQTAQNDVSVLK